MLTNLAFTHINIIIFIVFLSLTTMHPSSLYRIIYTLIFCDFTLSASSDGTDFKRWSEDDWFERRFVINTKFMFNQQPYEHVILRTKMNQWSVELSYGDEPHLNQIWTELHLYFDYYNHSYSLNNSIQGHILNICDPPIYSPITNDSNTTVPQLTQMNQHIANYFSTDDFFRTISYIHCRIDDRRLDPLLHIEIDIYFVTNREFHSLLYIELSNATYELFVNNQARFYLHNYDRNFRYNFNISNINYVTTSSTSLVYMIKLYNITIRPASNSMMITSNITILLLNLFIFMYSFSLLIV